MKKIILISFTAAAMACSPYEAKKPSADFIIKQNKVELTGDSIQILVPFELEHKGVADKVVFFLGSAGYKYSKPDNVGQPANNRGKLVGSKFYYPNVKDTIVCIATTIGEFGEEIKQDIKERHLITKN